jgi:hypothetical protein
MKQGVMSDDENYSVDMLLTQEEYSSGDEDEEDDDAEFWERTSNNEHQSTPTSNSRIKTATTSRQQRRSSPRPPLASTITMNSTGTTAFQQQQQQPSLSSTPLSVMTTEERITHHNAETAASPERSPASQTLHALFSQSNDGDLFYDMTQMEKDATSVILQLKEDSSNGGTERLPVSSNGNKRARQTIPPTESPQEEPKSTFQEATTPLSHTEQPQLETGPKQGANDKQLEPVLLGKELHHTGKTSLVQIASAPKRHRSPRPENTSRKQPTSHTNNNSLLGLQPQSLVPMNQQQQIQQGTKQLSKKDNQVLPQPHARHKQHQPPRLQVPVKPPRKEQSNQLLQQQEQQRLREKKGASLGDFEMFHIIVDKAGTLGMTVSVEPPPSDFVTRPGAKYCRIKSVEPRSLGYTYGLRGGDWVLADASGVYLAEYDDVVTTARSSVRPINFYVARKTESSPLQQEAELVVDQNTVVVTPKNDSRSPVPVDQLYTYTYQKQATVIPPSTVNVQRAPDTGIEKTSTASQDLPPPSKGRQPKRKHNEASSNEEDEVEIVLPDDDKVVPFCKLCNAPKAKKKTNGSHHALCPENEHFRASNADTILHDIISGVNLNCSLCVKAYRSGKAPKKGKTHAESCLYRRETLPTKAAKKTTKQKNAETKESKSQAATIDKQKSGADSNGQGRKKGQADRRRERATQRGTSTTRNKRDATAVRSEKSSTGNASRGSDQPRPDFNKAQSQPNQRTAPSSAREDLAGRFIRRSSAIEPSEHEINPRLKSQPNRGSTQSKRATPTGTGPPASGGSSAPGSGGNDSRRPLQAIPIPPIQHMKPQRTVSPPIDCLEHTNNTISSKVLAAPAHEDPPEKGLGNMKSTIVPSKGPITDRMQTLPQTSTVKTHSIAAIHATEAISKQGKGKVSATPATQNNGTCGEVQAITKHGPSKTRTTAVTITRDASSDELSLFAPVTFTETPSLSERNREHDPFAPCKTRWIPFANPWGPPGFSFSDEVVLTTARGIGHHEESLPSEIYSRNPFSASSSDYETTHHTPEEGFHFVRLQRDPMAMRSWGFSVRRHENGGACLVKSVDLMSPAENAVSFFEPYILACFCMPCLTSGLHNTAVRGYASIREGCSTARWRHDNRD